MSYPSVCHVIDRLSRSDRTDEAWLFASRYSFTACRPEWTTRVKKTDSTAWGGRGRGG